MAEEEEEVKLYLEISDNVMTLAHAKKNVSKQQGIEEWKDYSATAIVEGNKKFHTTSKKIWNYFKRFTKKNKTMKVGLRLKIKTVNNHVTLQEAKYCGPDEKWRPFSNTAIKKAYDNYNRTPKKGIRSVKRAIGNAKSSVANLFSRGKKHQNKNI